MGALTRYISVILRREGTREEKEKRRNESKPSKPTIRIKPRAYKILERYKVEVERKEKLRDELQERNVSSFVIQLT